MSEFQIERANLARVACVANVPLLLSDERFILTKGIVLRGGPGAPISYARQAEESYSGFSTSGAGVPLFELPSLINDVLVWIRDNTSLVEAINRPEVTGKIFYKPKIFEPVSIPETSTGILRSSNWLFPSSGSLLFSGGKGISIVAVEITNHGGETLGIHHVQVNLSFVNSKESYESRTVYPFDHPIITSSNFNVIPPGSSFRLHIDPVDVRPDSKASVTIYVRSESGRYGQIIQEILP